LGGDGRVVPEKIDGAQVAVHQMPPTVVEDLRRPVREEPPRTDRKSTRLNSSHGSISYAVFCLKKKKIQPAVPNRVYRLKQSTRIRSTINRACDVCMPFARAHSIQFIASRRCTAIVTVKRESIT